MRQFYYFTPYQIPAAAREPASPPRIEQEIAVTHPLSGAAQAAPRVVPMIEYRGERLQIMVSPEELAVIDDFRFRHRMPTRAAAVRELLKLGLASPESRAGASMKSSAYGVLSRVSDSPTETEG